LKKKIEEKIEKRNVFRGPGAPVDEVITLYTGFLGNPDVPLSHTRKYISLASDSVRNWGWRFRSPMDLCVCVSRIGTEREEGGERYLGCHECDVRTRDPDSFYGNLQPFPRSKTTIGEIQEFKSNRHGF
jgi:hypothetical protein